MAISRYPHDSRDDSQVRIIFDFQSICYPLGEFVKDAVDFAHALSLFSGARKGKAVRSLPYPALQALKAWKSSSSILGPISDLYSAHRRREFSWLLRTAGETSASVSALLDAEILLRWAYRACRSRLVFRYDLLHGEPPLKAPPE
jgi:hypothetical protein